MKNEHTINYTLRLLELLKKAPFKENYKGISYDVKTLFISAPVEDTIH